MSARPLHSNHSTPTTPLLILLVTLAATFVLTPAAQSQTIPLGTIMVGDAIPCGSSFYPGMSCIGASISCPSTDSLSVTIGYVGPTVATTSKGTIVFFSGGTGTTPAAPGEDLTTYSDDYVQHYRIVQIAWESAWEKAHTSGSNESI